MWLVVGLSRVRYVGNIARVVISNMIFHGLDPTIGQGNMVFTLCGIAIAVLIVAKVGSVIVIVDLVPIVVVGRLMFVLMRFVVGLMMVVRLVVISQGNSSKKGSAKNDGLKKNKYITTEARKVLNFNKDTAYSACLLYTSDAADE